MIRLTTQPLQFSASALAFDDWPSTPTVTYACHEFFRLSCASCFAYPSFKLDPHWYFEAECGLLPQNPLLFV